MYKGIYNLISRPKNSRRWLSLAIAFAIAMPSPVAEAVQKGKLIQMPAFLGLVVAIARLNAAMRSAAENPQDEFRRRNVRTALSAMPPAIIGLAAVFKAGKLHNQDLPMVQALLGGFVDVNATESYKKFLASPNAALIPKVGADLPANLMQVPADNGDGSRQSLGFDDSVAKGDAKLANDATIGKDPYAQGVQGAQGLMDSTAGYAGDRSPASDPAPIASSGSGADNSRAFTSTDRASAQAAFDGGAVNAPVGVVRDNANVGRSSMSDVNRDLLVVEAQQLASDNSKSSSSLDSDLFLKKPKPAKYQIQAKPKYWQFGRVLHLAEALLIHDAEAGEDCPSCAGGPKAGGPGGPGGGADAAGMLFGMAAMMAAVIPAIVASQQAQADQNIAKTQADAQKYMTDSTNANSQALAQMQQQTAIQTAQMQASVAQQNNQGVTQRLEMQLASLESARNQAAQAEQQRMALENSYNQQRIALAQKQADQNLTLARSTLSAQLTQAGLSQGTVASAASSGITVTPNGGMVASTNGVNDQPMGRVAELKRPGSEMGILGGSDGSPAGLASAMQPMNASSGGLSRTSGGGRLLASLGSDSATTTAPETTTTTDSNGKPVVKKTPGVTSLRGIASGDRLLAALRGTKAMVGGSTKPAMAAATTASVSPSVSGGMVAGRTDISSFISAGQSTSGGLADFQRHTTTARSIASQAAVAPAQGHSAAYRAP